MVGRVTALVLAVGAVGVGARAAAQPAEPPALAGKPADRPDPAAFLLPPVAAPAPAARAASPADDLPTRPGTYRDDLPPLPPERSKRAREDRDDRPPPPAARLAPPKDIKTVSAEEVDAADRPTRPAKAVRGDELFDALDDRRGRRRADDVGSRASDFGGKIGDKVKDVFDQDARRGWFQSDHAFDCIISPVTNPFLFEDPRSLTEIRPIVIYQKVPTTQPNFAGGNVWFYGGQTRLAITERFSLTVNKIGGTSVNAGSTSPYGSNAGLAEIWLGPKVTIIRNEDTGTLLAAGGIFQIPVGSEKVFQDTGRLSITPYVSAARPFLKSSFGVFNTMAAAGYSYSTDKERSDYLYASGHLDFDVANAHRFYPLVELNWLHYTNNGTARFVKGEGRDLINFGGLGKGSSLLTGAVGARVKLTRNTELGGAFEYPLVGNKDFFKYRFTMDFIWRY